MAIHICSRKTLQQVVKERPSELYYVVINDDDGIPDVIARSHNIIAPKKPTTEELKYVLDWAKDKDSLYIACSTGIVYSSAYAFLIACCRTSPDRAIWTLNANEHLPDTNIMQVGVQVIGEQILPDIRAFYERTQGWKLI